MSDTDDRKWCWAEDDGSETWYGPFDTREEVIAEANGTLGNEYESFAISRCNYADPIEAAERWAETLEPLGALNDNTDEELQDCDDGETYTYGAGAADGQRAKRELSELIVEWVRRNVRTRWFCADGAAVETIETIERKDIG